MGRSEFTALTKRNDASATVLDVLIWYWRFELHRGLIVFLGSTWAS